MSGPSSSLLRHSVLLMAATQAGNLLNVGFHALMGRKLSSGEYGVLYAMLGLIALAGLPLGAVHNAVTFYVTEARRSPRPGAVGAVLRRWGARMAAVGAGAALVGLAARAPLVRFYQLDHPAPLMAALAVIGIMMVLPVLTGGLLGLEAFGSLAVYQVVWPAVRVGAGGLAIMAGAAHAQAGLWGHAGGLAAAGVWAVWVLRSRDAGQGDGGSEASGTRAEVYLAGSLAILLGFGLLANADSFLVKRYFDPESAGTFAMAATIARTVVFLPQPIAGVLFPRVVSPGRAQAHHWPALRQALLYVAGLTLAAVAGCTLLPGLPLRVLYGMANPSAEMLGLVRGVCWAMSPLGLVFLLVHFELAQARYLAAVPIVVAAGLYGIGVSLFHGSLVQVAWAMGIAGWLALAGACLVVRAEARRSRTNPEARSPSP